MPPEKKGEEKCPYKHRELFFALPSELISSLIRGVPAAHKIAGLINNWIQKGLYLKSLHGAVSRNYKHETIICPSMKPHAKNRMSSRDEET